MNCPKSSNYVKDIAARQHPTGNRQKVIFEGDFFDGIKGVIKKNVPLKNYTTFKIGGPAKYFVEPEDWEDLKLLLESAKKNKIPALIIGAGSNLLVSDKGIDGLVIKLDSANFKKTFFDNNILKAASGCLLGQVIKDSQKRCLSDMEFLTGIPGTVGGALVMNAGISGKNIGDLVEDVTIMDYNGNIKTLTRSKMKFDYRGSGLSKYIVLNASFRLSKNRQAEIQSVIRNYQTIRKDKQELSLPSAGCVFKNPHAMEPAGRLIDLCGLKGRRIGDACVSEKHANFIVNMGHARASDVSMLMELVKEKVKNKFRIILKPEIKIWK